LNRPLLFLASAAIASVVVLALLVAALWAFGLFEKPEEVVYAHPVEVLSRSDRVDVAELIGADQRQLPRRPTPQPVEPLEIPRRQVTGFVQLEVAVDADGRVQSATVVNALPAGVYEEQALRQVQGRRYPPRAGGGSYVEIVPFRVPADEVPPPPEAD
jgi:TonB family protein